MKSADCVHDLAAIAADLLKHNWEAVEKVANTLQNDRLMFHWNVTDTAGAVRLPDGFEANLWLTLVKHRLSPGCGLPSELSERPAPKPVRETIRKPIQRTFADAAKRVQEHNRTLDLDQIALWKASARGRTTIIWEV